MNKLKLITVPYSFNQRLFEAYDDIFKLLKPDEWVCFLDGDTAFLEMADFGHVLQEYIDKYPDTGMFTCYATRCHYGIQKFHTVDESSDSIKYLAQKTLDLRKVNHLKVKEVERRIAGHLIMMKKATWNVIKKEVEKKSKSKRILGFDTKLSNALLKYKYKIRVMEGVLLFHYLRMLTGENDKIR